MLAMLLILLLIGVHTFAIKLLEMPDWQLISVTLMPTLPLLWAFFIFKKRFNTLEEYMQRLLAKHFYGLWALFVSPALVTGCWR